MFLYLWFSWGSYMWILQANPRRRRLSDLVTALKHIWGRPVSIVYGSVVFMRVPKDTEPRI